METIEQLKEEKIQLLKNIQILFNYFENFTLDDDIKKNYYLIKYKLTNENITFKELLDLEKEINEFLTNLELNFFQAISENAKQLEKFKNFLDNTVDTLKNEIEEFVKSIREAQSKIKKTEEISDLEKLKKTLLSITDNIMEVSDRLYREIEDVKKDINNYLKDLQSIQKRIEKFKEKLYYDELTGLYNKKGFEQKVKEELNLGNSLFLLFIDIDNFKNINDTYGHIAGDLILKKFAEILKQCVRGHDFIARIYGDEFMIVLTNIEEKYAKNIAERIRDKIEHTIFIYKDEKIKITISGGFTKIKKDDKLDEFMEKIDQLLYKAKQNKNQILYE